MNQEIAKQKLTVLLLLLEDNPSVEPIVKIDDDLGSDNYANYSLFLIGDDKEIRYHQSEDKFSFLDYHFEDLEIELKTAEQISEYYNGSHEAYGVPLIRNGYSYEFCKGYYEKMQDLMELIKEDLDAHNIN
jgi:hypothetical protein